MPQNERPPYWLPVEHSMLRRNPNNNYHVEHKAYMVTLKIEGMVPLLGKIVPTPQEIGNTASAVGNSASAALFDATRRIAECRLTPLGEAMRQAWLTLPQRFPNISVHDKQEEFVIMPEHFHGIIYVMGYMEEHLSDIVKLFKARVAMIYRRLLTQSANSNAANDANATSAANAYTIPALPAVGLAKDWLKAYEALTPEKQALTRQWIEEQIEVLFSATRRGTQSQQEGQSGQSQQESQQGGQSGQSQQGRLTSPIRVVASGSHNDVGFLFATGYVDSMMLDDDNLAGHRKYIYENPKSRWLRSQNRPTLKANRAPIDTAVTIKALMGYLQRECTPYDVTAEKLAVVRALLLLSATRRGKQPQQPAAQPQQHQAAQQQLAAQQQQHQTAQQQPAAQQQQLAAQPQQHQAAQQQQAAQTSWIECHSYGNRALLERRLLPVVCHRKDLPLFAQQKARCLEAAAEGAVMVSAGISRKEHEIMDAVVAAGFPVIRIADNGFPDLYHPSQTDIELCDADRLLIVTPWQYHYRHKEEAVFVAYCKTMNCIAQALCRTKDSWWKVR